MICKNSVSVAFFNGLPSVIREGIKVHLEKMERVVRGVCPGCVFTSGFRSPNHNKYVGGVLGSSHTYGCGLDVQGLNVEDLEVLKKKGFFVLVETDHVHLTFKGDL